MPCFNQQIVIRYTSEVTLPCGYKCLTVKTVSVRLRSSPQVPSIQEWNIQFGHVQIRAWLHISTVGLEQYKTACHPKFGSGASSGFGAMSLRGWQFGSYCDSVTALPPTVSSGRNFLSRCCCPKHLGICGKLPVAIRVTPGDRFLIPGQPQASVLVGCESCNSSCVFMKDAQQFDFSLITLFENQTLSDIKEG